MKKIALPLLSALCGTLIFAGEPAPAGDAPRAGVEGKVTVRSGQLNFRLAPTQKSPVAAKLPGGSPVRVLSVRGNWIEVEAPESTPVYVSEAYIQGGRTIRELNMRSRRDSGSALIGVLPKGSEVKLLNERAHGWVRIAPPRDLRLFTVKFYVEFDEAALAAAKAAEKPAAEAKPAAKAAEKPAAEAKPAAKAAEKPAAETKPAAKAAEKPAAEAKPAAKAAEKPAAEAKPAAKAAEKPRQVPKILMAELVELGVQADAKPAAFDRVGTLTKVTGSQSPATDYALIYEGENRGFVVPIAPEVFRKELVEQSARVIGRAYRIKAWKAPIVVVERMERP